MKIHLQSLSGPSLEIRYIFYGLISIDKKWYGNNLQFLKKLSKLFVVLINYSKDKLKRGENSF